MQIDFQVKGNPVSFRRDAAFGKAELIAGGQSLELQSPLSLSTHISFKLLTKWEANVYGSNVVIEKKRKLFLAGLRPSDYRVFVDGQLVVEASGL